MASSIDYLTFILDQLSGLEEITYRQMMGEFVLYYRDKVIGGIYDNRFLIKPVDFAVNKMSEARYVVPYSSAKPMLLVDNVDNRDYLSELISGMYEELPELKKKRKKVVK